MTIQEWIVAIVVLLCVAEVIRRIIRFFRSSKNDGNPCANCAGGCDLKRMLDESKRNIGKPQRKGIKKCCS